MEKNLSVEILRVVFRNPYISPTLIHDKIPKGITSHFYTVQTMLRAFRELGLVETPSRGNYLITKKGVEVLRNSSQEATEDG